MKLGILKCDSVDDVLVKDFGEYADMFIKLLSSPEPSIKFSIYDIERLQFPHRIDECDAYLITGSRHGAYEDHRWIPPLEDFIRSIHSTSSIKLLGICFGHQIIAKALGGDVKKSLKGWGLGVSSTEYISEQNFPWNTNDERIPLNLIVIHQDQVVQPPPNSEVILTSDFCPNHMLAIGSNILTIQGHPEFDKDYLQGLMRIKRNVIPKEVLNCALESLNKHTDEKMIARWFIRFLAQ